MIYLTDKLEDMRESSKVALIYRDEKLEYKSLYKKCSLIANNIRSRNLSEHIGIYMHNSIDFVICFLGVLFSGKKAIVLKREMTSIEVNRILLEMGAGMLISDGIEDSTICEIVRTNDLLVPVAANNPYVFEENDIAFILTTSGTTGTHKLVPITYKNLNASFEITKRFSTRNENGIELAGLSFATRLGIESQLITALSLGMTIVIPSNRLFKPNSFLAIAKEYSITNTSLVPSMVRLLIQYLRRNPDKILNLENIEIWVAGEYLAIEDINFIRNYCTQIKLVIAYGLTETGPIACNGGIYIEGKEESVGQVFEDENVKITINACSEIMVRGKAVSPQAEQFNKGTENKEWLNTGDLGIIDEDGYLFIFGRSKNIINSGGHKVSPEEVEKVILKCPLISDVLVKGELDKDLGEKIVAFIVPVELNVNLNIDDIRKLCTEELATYKLPHKFVICESINLSRANKKSRK